MKVWRGAAVVALSGCLAAAGMGLGQVPVSPSPVTTPPAPGPDQSQQPTPSQTAPASPASGGTVLFQSHGEPPPVSAEPVDPQRKVLPLPPPDQAQDFGSAKEADTGAEFSDRERGALLFTAYDLDAQIVPAAGKLTMRARVTVQNTGAAPLPRIALQVSSALTWESISAVSPAGSQKLPFAQHLLDTDTDHTGKASEALLELPAPLAPGASLTLDTFYSGVVAQSAERLERIGANAAQGEAADWDAIGREGVSLRGFGNVLWYPVSAPQLFLGEGTKLFEALDTTRLREQAATVRLRLRVEYAGDPPTAVYFCGRRAAFSAVSDAPDAPIAGGSGVATAEFAAEPLGFRAPSLFVVERPEELLAPLGGELANGEPMLAVEITNPAASSALAAATEHLVPLLQQWLGARPLSALTVLDHPGQPFQDGPVLVAPAASLAVPETQPALMFSLAHAWVQSGRPWVDEGLAQFFALLQVEQAGGRDAMVAKLGELMRPLAEGDSEALPTTVGPEPAPLIAAGSETIFRRKAAAVWLMLREIVGDQDLQVTLGAWRFREPAPDGPRTTPEQDAEALEALLEKNSGKDLHRFFDDWVLHDRRLPELTLADVTPRALPTTLNGHPGGWLTAVTVSNAGQALADVPVIVSSGSFSTTVRLQVPGGGSATARVQTESAPTEVQVNDGITPEVRTSVHRREVRSR